MRTLGLRTLAAAVVVGGALVLPRPVAGHALLIASDPKAGSTLTAAPAVVTLTFGEAPDLGLSTVRILDSGGNDQAAGPIEAVSGEPDQVRVQVKPLPDGVYTVAWRTVSTVDGHVAAGSFAFGVGLPPPPTTGGEPTLSSPSASVAATIARWLLYLGLVALFGAGFLGFAIEPRAPRAIVWMAVAGWSVGLVGTLAIIGVQWSDSGVDIGAMLRSSIGLGAFERVGVMVAAAVPVAALWPRRPPPRWLLGLVAAGGAAAMLVDVLNGHAANGESWLLQIAVQWVHVVGVGIWIGGLAALLLAVRGAPSAEKAHAVHTFSTWAGVALAAVAATGFLRALSEVQTMGALFTTDFGVVVILKTVGLGILALLGATNRFFNVPAAVRTLRGLRRVGSTELVIGTAVLVATGFLANLAPPSAGGGEQEAAPRPVAATGSDFGTSVRVRLVVEPGTAGFNDFTAEATDYDSGAAIVADRIQLRFALASRSGIGGSTLELTPQADGGYAAHGGNLALDGIWRVTATLDGPNGSVEVPLVVSTQVEKQQVDAIVTAGAPTIYAVHVADGSSVQVYADPGTAGANELHMTFFDAAGAELPIPTATAAISPEDGGATLLDLRQIEPGHFVADVALSAGTIGVDIIGQAPGGAPIHVHLDIVVGT